MFGDGQALLVFRGPFGVRVEVQASFLLLALLILGFGTQTGAQLLWGAAAFLILAVSIFLHEVGHAAGCAVQGVPVTRIVLYGGGGYCERAVKTTARQDELIVAMGPIVNLTLWALTSLVAEHLWNRALTEDREFGGAFYAALFLLQQAALINLVLALFNLMPVQPLDGGKLLRLALLRMMRPAAATRLAGGIGLVLSVIWIPAMIWVFFTVGWVLFFVPSIRRHYAMYSLRGFGAGR